MPFDIPDSWEWVRLGSIGETNIGLTYKPSDVASAGTPVLRSNNIQNGQMNYSDLLFVNCPVPGRAYAHKGDILICARNGSRALVGKSAIVDADGMAFGAFMAIFRSRCNPYIQLFINSYLFRGQLDGATTTTINQVTKENDVEKEADTNSPWGDNLLASFVENCQDFRTIRLRRGRNL